jgi:hypothetical protein
MAGLKLSAKAQEEHDFLEQLLTQCDHLLALTEQYVGAKGAGQEQIFQTITRSLQQIRQNAMIKNLGPIADAAGMLAVAAGRGAPVQRARTLREGLSGYKTNIERTMKALVAADARERVEQEKVAARRKAAQLKASGGGGAGGTAPGGGH